MAPVLNRVLRTRLVAWEAHSVACVHGGASRGMGWP